MNKIQEVLEYVQKKYAPIEDGDEIPVVCNDGIVIISLIDGNLKVNIIAGEPDKLDIDLGLLEHK